MTMQKSLAKKTEVEIREKNRFTEFISPDSAEGMKSLYNWLDWFKERGIPARLRHSRIKGFAVYREGLFYGGE